MPLDVECIDVSRAAAAAAALGTLLAGCTCCIFSHIVFSHIVARIVLAACTCRRIVFACMRQTTVDNGMCHRTGTVVHIGQTPFLVFPNNLTIPALSGQKNLLDQVILTSELDQVRAKRVVHQSLKDRCN